MEFLSNLLSGIFTPAPGSSFSYYPHLIILAIALIAGGTIFGIIYDKKKNNDPAFKKLFKKTARRTVILGALILGLLAVRYENIPYFSMRLWLYLTFALTFLHFYHVFKIYKKDYPREKENVKLRMSHKKSEKKNKSKYTTSKRRQKKKQR